MEEHDDDDMVDEEEQFKLLESLKNNTSSYASFLEEHKSIVGLDKYSFLVGCVGSVSDDDGANELSLDLDSNTFTLVLSFDFESNTDTEKINILSRMLVDGRLLLFEERKCRLVELEEAELSRDFYNLVLKSNALFLKKNSKTR